MTPYEKLKAHLERHMYKRGQFKGEAPADPTNRGKNHFRVVRGHGGQMCVRMYATDLIEVTQDNTVYISMGGWWTSTTKKNLTEAIRRFLGWTGYIGSQVLYNHNQMCIRVNGKTYKFYDGMTFDYAGNLLSRASFFERKRVDRAATAEFRKDIEESGFKAVWPVLFSTADVQNIRWVHVDVHKAVTQECFANTWATLAAQYKCKYSDHKAAYAALVRDCTRDMTEVVKTDVSVIV